MLWRKQVRVLQVSLEMLRVKYLRERKEEGLLELTGLEIVIEDHSGSAA